MSKTAKIWLVIATSLVLVGCVIFGGLMTMLKWDFSKLSTKKFEMNTYEINEEFNNLSIKTDTSDIVFALSDDGKCRIECYEEKKTKHSVTVHENTLVIYMIDERSWYDYIGINFTSPKITVYLPKSEYISLLIKESTADIEIPKDFKFVDVDVSLSTGDVKCFASATDLIKIKATTGDIQVENISAGALDISASTGDVTVSNVICEADVKIGVSTGKINITDTKCKNLISSGNTGDVYLENVIAKEKFSLTRSTGDVKLKGANATEIFIKTDTGDVIGTLLADKVFIVQTDTGSVDVPKTLTGGRCEITTDTGDIKIEIA